MKVGKDNTSDPYRHQEIQFPLWYAVHLGTESEHQVLVAISVSFMRVLLFGTKFQSSCKRREDEERKQSNEAAMKDLVLSFCPTMHSVLFP